MLLDNGNGPTIEELRTFFSKCCYGKSKNSEATNNFGIGSKTDLLPWTPYGVVVAVYGKDGEKWYRRLDA